MKEWKEYNIGEICDTISDTYKGNASNVVLINTSDVLEGKCLNHTFVPNKDLRGQFKKQFKKNDILYSEIRPANKRYAFIDFEPTDYIASTKLMVIRSNDKVLPKFLYYILQSKEMIENLQFLAESRSGTFPQITFSELAIQTILLPEVKEQNIIVNFLEALDSKIELNRRINDNLEQQAQALFKSWFVDFKPFKDGIFVNSDFGMIPNGWKIATIGDYCKIRSGFAFKSSWWTDNGVKIVKIKNISSSGILDMNDCSYVSKENISKAKEFSLKSGDLLIAMTGATIGKFCIVPVLKEEMYVNQRVGKFFLGENPILKVPFIYGLLKSENIISQIINKGQGSAQPNISANDIESIPIILPTNEIISKYNKLVSPYFSLLIEKLNECSYLANLRDTLLPRLMSSELEIRNR